MKGKREHTGKKWRKLMQAVRAAALLTAGVLGLIRPGGMETVRAVSLSNPRIATDSGMTAGQKVTWDCVWFGSYPQAEVIPSNVAYTALDASIRRDGDIIVSDSVYAALRNASGWDTNNDITLNGVKYRRIKKGDATYTGSGSGYYQWADSASWHYFRYEPIKWRVLSTNGNQALLLSDIALDDQKYHTKYESVTWETSTLRSWLNGYSAGSNKQSVDYRQKNFLSSAFTASERAAIARTSLENANNIEYGTEGGNNTTDKIFLLSESDVWNTDTAKAHGFVKKCNTYDEARRCQSSAYAKAMGMYSDTDTAYAGNGWWWLRSPGSYERYAMYVCYDGQVDRDGYDVSDFSNGVRSALNLNLSSSNLYTYAGTVRSDGTVNENGEQNYTVYFSANGGNVSPSSKSVTYGNTYGALPIPTRSGYTFAGWYTASGGGSQVTESTTVNTASNHTLYAHWTELSRYTVAYDANGGSGAPSPQEKAHGSALTLSSTVPTRAGYTFKGWATSSSAASAIYQPGGTYRADWSVTLYAVWEKIPSGKNVTVFFNANGGNCSLSQKEVIVGSDYGPLPIPIRDGYLFTGWYYGEGQVTETTKVSYSVLHVLYAHWKKDGSTVQKPSVPSNPSVSLTPSVDLKAVARKNHAITVSSGDLSLKSATGITEADKYLSLGKIQMGTKRFTLKLKVDGVSRITYKSSSKKTASISSKGVVKIKGVGQTTITVTGTLNSTGKKITKKYTLTVNPDRPALKEVRAVGDRKMRFSWKKCKRGDGYELWYSLSKTFKKNTKGRTIPKTGNTIGTLTGLISGAKYYVKVRTYKVVSGKVYYSNWSKTKSVTIK